MKKRWAGWGVPILVVAVLLLMPFCMSMLGQEAQMVVLQPVLPGSGTPPDSFPEFSGMEECVTQMESVLENESFILYFHKQLATVTLYDKTNRQYYSSNPYDLAAQDVDNAAKNELASQVLITYYNDESNQGRMNSFKDCVQRNQFEAKVNGKELTVRMMLGESSDSAPYPEQISASSLEAFMQGLDEESRDLIGQMYERYTVEGFNDDTRASLLKQYPYLETEDLYVLQTMPKRTKRLATALFEEKGYTAEKKQAEYKKIGYKAESALPAFSLTLHYMLTEDGLTVSLPLEEISYDSGKLRLDTVTLLPYFGCGVTTDVKGILMIPDGSGAVMDYNHDYSKRLSALSLQVYGTDAASVSDYTVLSAGQPTILPVFGNSHRNGAFLAVIDQGESLCKIVADAGDRTSPYATAYATASYQYSEMYYYNDKDFSKNVRAYAEEANKGTITVTYLPLRQGSSYVDMAQAYRTRLLKNDTLTERTVKPRLLLQLLGMAGTGSETFALTTFQDAAGMTSELIDVGIDSMAIRYLGWNAGGMDNTFAKEVDLDGRLGGQKAYEHLRKYLDAREIPLYMDMELAYVRQTRLFDGYAVNRDTCRTLRNQLTGLYRYNYGENDVDATSLAYAVAPARIQETAEALQRSFTATLKNAHLSAGSLGSALHSTFKSGSIMTRTQVQATVTESLEKLSGGKKLMVEHGNAYTLPYVDFVVNLPVTSSGYEASDYDIPFVQLVLNGCVEYAPAPINESENHTDQLLKALETGSDLNFVAAYRNQNKLKNSDQSQYYSVNYTTLKEMMSSLYQEYKKAFSEIGTTQIRDHNCLAENVYCTVYDSGVTVYVNYGIDSYIGESVTVPAKGYRIVKEGKR